MNEFTLSELEDLHYAIRFFWKNRGSYDLPSDTDGWSCSYSLMEKIKSMINKYPSEEMIKKMDLKKDVDYKRGYMAAQAKMIEILNKQLWEGMENENKNK